MIYYSSVLIEKWRSIMKKLFLVVCIISLVCASIPATSGLSLPKPGSIQIPANTTRPTGGNETPPAWAKGNFSGVWGITLFGVPAAPLGWITGYYENIGLGKLEAKFAVFNQTNATATLIGFMLWIFFFGGVTDRSTGNSTWVSGIGVANETHYYMRLNAIIGPSYYIFCTYTPFENTTAAFIRPRMG
jgi:hypothetical protein